MKSIWDDVEAVTNAIRTSITRKETIEKLSRSPTTAQYRRLKRFESSYNIDVSHFTPNYSSARVNATVQNRQYSTSDIFCKNSPANSSTVKRRIKRESLIEFKCRDCGLTGMWNDKPLVLQLEHIDGDNTNQELINLCYLCPNCHSQTDTFCGRNVEYKTKSKQTAEQRTTQRKLMHVANNQHLIDAVLNSNIDFGRRGWSKQVAELIEKPTQKTKDWMVRYLPELYAKCLHHRVRTTI